MARTTPRPIDAPAGIIDDPAPASRFTAVAVFAGAWTALVLMRIAVNLSVRTSQATTSVSRLVAIVFFVGLFWIGASAVVFALDRSRLATGPRILVGAHILVAATIVAVEPLWMLGVLEFAAARAQREYAESLLRRFDLNLLLYGVVVGADMVWLQLRRVREQERSAARLKEAVVDAQLHALALQLQPHFLFNALQLAAETLHENVGAARRTLVVVRDLLRRAFALEGRHEVTVGEEVDFLRAYADIQHARFGDRFAMWIAVDPATLDAAIPPLLLQPLVENSVRHGLAPRGRGGRIDVAVHAAGERLEITVTDDGIGLPIHVRDGHGLSVTRRRLARLYGGDANLRLSGAPGGGTRAHLHLPLHAPRESPTAADAPLHSVPRSMRDGWFGKLSLGARIAVGWLGFFAVMAALTHVALRLWPASSEPGEPSRWAYLLMESAVGVPFWVALTVVAVMASGKLRGVHALPIHALFAGTIAVLHALLGDRIADQLFHMPSKLPQFVGWGMWDAIAYAALALLARTHELGEWARAKLRETVKLGDQMEQARRKLGRMRQMQPLLFAALDGVISIDDERALEKGVLDFAELLRVVLTMLDSDAIPADADARVAEAYRALRSDNPGMSSVLPFPRPA